MWASVQHLSFQDCQLTDEQTISSLADLKSLMELSVDGNECKSLGMMKALYKEEYCQTAIFLFSTFLPKS
jgi:hypothetical protein